MKIYVGSSWKNAAALDAFHVALRAAGHETWDFRQHGFGWEDVAPKYMTDPWVFLDAPECAAAFAYDKRGLDWADAGLFVLPAGTSVALEAGYLAGRGKPIVTIGRPREPRMDVMWLFAAQRFGEAPEMSDVIAALAGRATRGGAT